MFDVQARYVRGDKPTGSSGGGSLECRNPVGLFDGHSLDLLERGQPLEGFVHTVLNKGGHAFSDGVLEQVFGLGFALDQTFHLVRADQQFMKR